MFPGQKISITLFETFWFNLEDDSYHLEDIHFNFRKKYHPRFLLRTTVYICIAA